MNPPSLSAESLRQHVQTLAGDIGHRDVNHPDNLRRAVEYIERQWRAEGYEVTRQAYTVDRIECLNLEVSRTGIERPSEIILLGAHYDSVVGSKGANDNASGVAALLEVARWMATQSPRRTVRFVAFVNEEPPFFQTGAMGSEVYARAARERGDDIRAMISLETIGYYSDERGSQKYPPLFKLFYPDRGNFIAFVSDLHSRSVMHEGVAAFRANSDFPTECVATFASISGIDWSDHASFWKEGYRAFMITDTAPYRYPYYHSEEDTPDKLNYEAFARVTSGLCRTALALASGN